MAELRAAAKPGGHVRCSSEEMQGGDAQRSRLTWAKGREGGIGDLVLWPGRGRLERSARRSGEGQSRAVETSIEGPVAAL